MNLSKKYVYQRMITDKGYKEDLFDTEFTNAFREEFQLGEMSDKNVHNLLIAIFVTSMSNRSMPIWKKDVVRLFGSILNRRKDEFFLHSNYTRKLWKRRKLVRRPQSRSYMARRDVIERILSLTFEAPMEKKGSLLSQQSMWHLPDAQKNDPRSAMSALFYLVTDPRQAFKRGAGRISFTSLSAGYRAFLIGTVLQEKGLPEAENIDFVRFGMYRRPSRKYYEYIKAHVDGLLKYYDTMKQRAAVDSAQTLWLFEEAQEAI